MENRKCRIVFKMRKTTKNCLDLSYLHQGVIQVDGSFVAPMLSQNDRNERGGGYSERDGRRCHYA